MRAPRLNAFLKWFGRTLIVFFGGLLTLQAAFAASYPDVAQWGVDIFEAARPVVTASWFIILSTLGFFGYIATLVLSGGSDGAASVVPVDPQSRASPASGDALVRLDGDDAQVTGGVLHVKEGIGVHVTGNRSVISGLDISGYGQEELVGQTRLSRRKADALRGIPSPGRNTAIRSAIAYAALGDWREPSGDDLIARWDAFQHATARLNDFVQEGRIAVWGKPSGDASPIFTIIPPGHWETHRFRFPISVLSEAQSESISNAETSGVYTDLMVNRGQIEDAWPHA